MIVIIILAVITVLGCIFFEYLIISGTSIIGNSSNSDKLIMKMGDMIANKTYNK